MLVVGHWLRGTIHSAADATLAGAYRPAAEQLPLRAWAARTTISYP